MKQAPLIIAIVLVLVFLFGNESEAEEKSGTGAGFSRIVPNNVLRWASIAIPEGMRQRIDPAIILAVIWEESYGSAGAIGSSGEKGLMQVKPVAARQVGYDDTTTDPDLNIRIGTKYLAWCFDQTDTAYNALRTYNAGPTGAARHPNNGAAYANRVLDYYDRIKKSTNIGLGI